MCFAVCAPPQAEVLLMTVAGRLRSVVVPMVALIASSAAAPGCVDDSAEPAVEAATQSVSVSVFPAHAARQWMVTLANCIKFDGISPPVASRTFSYAAIAIYESLVHGMPGHKSLA